MPPPLSQADLEAIDRMVDAKVAAKLAAVKRRVDDHSGQYRQLGEKLRDSQSEFKAADSSIKAEVVETVGAISRRDHQIIEALNELRAMVEKSHAPATAAAGDAKTQATEAATEARNAGIDLKLVKKDAARAAAWWRHPAVTALLLVFLDWLLFKLLGFLHG